MTDRRLEILGLRPIVAGTDGDKLYVSLDSAKDAMDDYMKECCLELMEYMANNKVVCCANGANDRMFIFKGEWITKEQLFENFL